MAIVVSILFVMAVLGFGIYAFSGISKLRGGGAGEQSAEMWYSRFADRGRRRHHRH